MREEQFGPIYNVNGASLVSHRRKAKHGLAQLTQAERRAYGEAVEKAILANQRQALQRELPSHNCNCASGTNHNSGEAIHKAMQEKQRAALLACPSQERRKRPDHVVKALYEDAMARKNIQ